MKAESTTPTIKSRSFLHFGEIEIQPGESAIFVKAPMIFLRGEKLIFDCAQDLFGLFVKNIYVGSGQSQFIDVGDHGMPCRMFGPHVNGNELKFSTCSPGQSMAITVENRNDTARLVSATIFGPYVQ